MIEESDNMTEYKIRTFFAAIICAFTILGISSCALFPMGNTPAKKEVTTTTKEVTTTTIVATEESNRIHQAVDASGEVLPYSYNALWLASKKAISQMGFLKNEQRDKGHLEARVHGADVSITITKLGPTSARLKVLSLREPSNDADVSDDVFDKIKDLAKLF